MRPTDAAEEGLVLRPASPHDRPAMAVVQRRARVVAAMPDVTLATAAQELAQGWDGDEFWVAQERGEVVGYVRLVRPDAMREGWLDDLYVLPEAAGRGVGTALLDLVKGLLRDGFGLWVHASNSSARAFYRARGLDEVELVPAWESPRGESEVRVTWRRVPPVGGLA
ncbi:GNAT family N-acetyltransferase [Nocardioides malaquae]|nr:GNAT family N-acetyltransferase [Nocardioides malaquae]